MHIGLLDDLKTLDFLEMLWNVAKCCETAVEWCPPARPTCTVIYRGSSHAIGGRTTQRSSPRRRAAAAPPAPDTPKV